MRSCLTAGGNSFTPSCHPGGGRCCGRLTDLHCRQTRYNPQRASRAALIPLRVRPASRLGSMQAPEADLACPPRETG